ncbi:hypothetical protein [Providencia rettgeri]|uniref:hypothetical protein n=1 Tax=Providencia rettgeri TaxID=587 RepID=UPI0034E0A856
MLTLNNLLINQGDIILAPGDYFHPEFSREDYHLLPPLLQGKHNQYLIKRYQLPLPKGQTLLLPKLLLQHWKQLPTIAVHLGALLQMGPQPWSEKFANRKTLEQYFNQPLNSHEILGCNKPETLIVLGAAQVLSYLAPFGYLYTERAKYMFSQDIQKLITTHTKAMLPWNIIEETCHYVSRNRDNKTRIRG